MLTEEMRILAGLQNSRNIENPLPLFLKSQQLKESQNKKEKKDVISHFNIFQEKIEEYNLLIQSVSKLLKNELKKEFMNGLYESKYTDLHMFANIIINENLSTAMSYLEKNYTRIKSDVDKIIYLSEIINENNAKIYFVSTTLITHDPEHDIKIPVFKDKSLEEKVSNEIKYGSEIMYLTEDLTIIKYAGKKYYTKFTIEQLEYLEKKGFII